MDRKPTNGEWADVLRPFLSQFHRRAARKRLCQLHRGQIKESKVQCPWPTGEACFATINAHSLKIWILSPDGGSVYMEYDAHGHPIKGNGQPTGNAGNS